MVDGGVGSQEEEEEEGEGGEGHYKVVLAIMVKKEKDDRHSRCLFVFLRADWCAEEPPPSGLCAGV